MTLAERLEEVRITNGLNALAGARIEDAVKQAVWLPRGSILRAITWYADGQYHTWTGFVVL